MANRPRLIGPVERIAAADQQASDAERAFEVASTARLAEIEMLSPRDQLRALEDPVLVPADRERLRRTLDSALPIRGRSRRMIPRAMHLRRLTPVSTALFTTPTSCR